MHRKVTVYNVIRVLCGSQCYLFLRWHCYRHVNSYW